CPRQDAGNREQNTRRARAARDAAARGHPRRCDSRMSAESHRVTSAGVLICDDTALIRKLVSMVIGNSFGLHVVGEATDGNEAVVEAKRLQPDVIVLDLAMPHRSG